MRFGCCVGFDRIGVVQEAGYDYVELPVAIVDPDSPDAEFDQVRERMGSFQIVPEVWNCLLPQEMKVTGPTVDKDRVESFLRTAFRRIEELGGEVVVFGSSTARNVPDGFSVEEARSQILEFVTLAGRIAGMHGITLAVEPQNSRNTNIITTVGEALDLVRAADHPFVKLMADLYHMDEEKDPVHAIVDAGNELVHTHTADTGRRYPGSGSYPHVEFFEALRSIGYNDRVSVECQWGDFAVECAKALEFLRGLDAEIPF